MIEDIEYSLIDSHCHLDYEKLYLELDNVIMRSKEHHVSEMVSICTTLDDIKKIELISKKYDFIWHTAGVHHHKASIDKLSYNLDEIKKNCQNEKCVGVGEAGLDYYYDFSLKKDQRKSFETQINVSQSLDLPIVVHSRDADKDMQELLVSNYSEKLFKGVLHCFTGGKQLAKSALDIGFYISFSGIVTFKNSHELQEIASYVPSDRYLIETDSPFLSPVPFRGKTNEPKNTYFIAECISRLRNTTLQNVAYETRRNTLNLFNKMRPV